MKNGRKEEKVIVIRGVKQTLTQYRADAPYAQDLRRDAKAYAEGLLAFELAQGATDSRAAVERLLLRLAHTQVVLFSFYVKADQHPVVELHKRMKYNTNFAKFVMFQVAPALAKGKLDLRCLPKHRKSVKHALNDLWLQQAADHNGWQSFTHRTHPITGERTLMKISEADARDHKVHMQNAGTDFMVLHRLGYRSDITCKAAAKLDAIDPLKRDIHGGWVSVSVEDAIAIRENRSAATDQSNPSQATSDPFISPWDDENAWYDTSLKLVTPGEQDRRDFNRLLLQKIRENDVKPYLDGKKVADFVPPLAKQAQGRGGAGYWETHLKDRNGRPIATQVVQTVAVTNIQHGPYKAPSDRWLAERKSRQLSKDEYEAERQARLDRRALLDADDAEVREHAQTDVLETIFTLLEQQVQETKRKAPKGVIGALAAARLEMQRNTARIAQHLSGLTVLENAAAPARV